SDPARKINLCSSGGSVTESTPALRVWRLPGTRHTLGLGPFQQEHKHRAGTGEHISPNLRPGKPQYRQSRRLNVSVALAVLRGAFLRRIVELEPVTLDYGRCCVHLEIALRAFDDPHGDNEVDAIVTDLHLRPDAHRDVSFGISGDAGIAEV